MHFLIVILSLCTSIASQARITLDIKPLNDNNYALAITFDIEDYDGLYEQYVNFWIDDPDIELSKINCSVEPAVRYAPAFKDSKSVFLGPCIFTAMINTPCPDSLSDAQLYVTYQLLSEKHSHTIALPLAQRSPVASDTATVDPSTSSGKTVEKTSVNEKNLNLAPNKTSPQKLDETQNTASHPALPELVDGSTGFEALLAHIDISTSKTKYPATPIPMGLLSLMCALTGLVLLFKASYAKRFAWRSIAASLGMALIACSVVLAEKTYQVYYQNKPTLETVKKNNC